MRGNTPPTNQAQVYRLKGHKSGETAMEWVITVITAIRAHQSASWPKERPGSGNQDQKSPAEPPPAPLILAFHVYVSDKVSMTVGGAYRALYILNWAYRYFTEQHYVHWISMAYLDCVILYLIYMHWEQSTTIYVCFFNNLDIVIRADVVVC
uniref:Uncharacterized protein n=1 Tax=Oryza glumipatula TaxID=40148 RepID=A0A0E0B2Q7_9ORYZ